MHSFWISKIKFLISHTLRTLLILKYIVYAMLIAILVIKLLTVCGSIDIIDAIAKLVALATAKIVAAMEKVRILVTAKVAATA